MPTYAHNFADIKRQATFEAVCAHYNLALVGHGAQRSALCPFHNDTKPSLKINLEKKIFHCFGCEAKGNSSTSSAGWNKTPTSSRRPRCSRGSAAHRQPAPTLLRSGPLRIGRPSNLRRPPPKTRRSRSR